MDRTERFYRIQELLQSGQSVPIERFLEKLSVSRATFKRDLEYLRDRMNAPIEWDRFAGGYRYAAASSGPAFSLPGLWFNAAEARALLLTQQLLAELQPGLLEPRIRPLQTRLRAVLGGADHSAEEVERRFRLVTAARRTLVLHHFEAVASATLGRKRLRLTHYSRQNGQTTERTVSPQQMVFYRDNWYLVGWCHLRQDLRNFAIDAVESAEVLDKPAREVSHAALAKVMESGYGIFSGHTVHWASLRFSPERARWVSAESWHPEQRGRFDEQGHWLLDVPYNDPRELIMEILRHGEAVQVLSPAALRDQVIETLQTALHQYQGAPEAAPPAPSPPNIEPLTPTPRRATRATQQRTRAVPKA